MYVGSKLPCVYIFNVITWFFPSNVYSRGSMNRDISYKLWWDGYGRRFFVHVLFSLRCAVQFCLFFSFSTPLIRKKYEYNNVVKRAANSSNTIENSPRKIFKDSYSCSEYNVMGSTKWYIQIFDSLNHVSENSKLLIFSLGLDHLSDYTQVKRHRSHYIESK
jgi:hypothetical protein